MELYLQFGYGMIEHCKELLTRWNGGTVILSPRDLKQDQLLRTSQTIRKIGNAKCLIDPQFYLPHSDHERLCSHDYWPSDYSTGTFFNGPALGMLLTKLANLNRELGSLQFILPGLLASSINDDWIALHKQILEEASSLNLRLPLYPTLALSDDAMKSEADVSRLLEAVQDWSAEGFYLVCEHPKGAYLVDDPSWLANVLDLVAGLRIKGAKVIIGYCNHQMLVASAAKANAIASGTWMNVRSFPPEKFRAVYDEEIKQRSIWYYCPQALSEYKIPFLSIAEKMNVLDKLVPEQNMVNEYVKSLFENGKVSPVGITEQAAFRHYLVSLQKQVVGAVRPTYDETLDEHKRLLDNAEKLLGVFAGSGVRGQQRDFSEIIDANRAALNVLNQTRGPMLRRLWTQLN